MNSKGGLVSQRRASGREACALGETGRRHQADRDGSPRGERRAPVSVPQRDPGRRFPCLGRARAPQRGRRDLPPPPFPRASAVTVRLQGPGAPNCPGASHDHPTRDTAHLADPSRSWRSEVKQAESDGVCGGGNARGGQEPAILPHRPRKLASWVLGGPRCNAGLRAAGPTPTLCAQGWG